MKFSFTLRTVISLALCLYVCIAVISAQAVTSTPAGGGKSGGPTVPSAMPTSAKGDQPSMAVQATTAATTNTTSKNGCWRLESSWVFTATSAIFIISRMAV